MRGAIIYVSSNQEDPKFEQKIIQDMDSKRGDLHVNAVTQKPITLYNCTNKVVGAVGVSGFNFVRQLQIAVEMADADYVISCEADCLYPTEYFRYKPKWGIYRNTNNYIIPYKKEVYWKKDSQTAFQIATRNVFLARLDYLLHGQPEWSDMISFPKEIGKKFLDSYKTFTTKHACLTIKTGNGMRKYSHTDRKDIYKLPYWGYASELCKSMMD